MRDETAGRAYTNCARRIMVVARCALEQCVWYYTTDPERGSFLFEDWFVKNYRVMLFRCS